MILNKIDLSGEQLPGTMRRRYRPQLQSYQISSVEILVASRLVPNPYLTNALVPWTTNLLATSQHNNLIFVATGREICVFGVDPFIHWDPNRDRPIFDRPIRTLKMSGVYNPLYPSPLVARQEINRVECGMLGIEEVVVAVDTFGHVCLWFTNDLDRRPLHFENEQSSWSFATQQNSWLLAVGSNSHRISLFNLAASHDNVKVDSKFPRHYPFASLIGHSNNIPSLSMSACAKYLASACIDGSFRVWDLARNECIWEERVSSDYGWCCKFITPTSIEDGTNIPWDSRRLLLINRSGRSYRDRVSKNTFSSRDNYAAGTGTRTGARTEASHGILQDTDTIYRGFGSSSTEAFATNQIDQATVESSADSAEHLEQSDHYSADEMDNSFQSSIAASVNSSSEPLPSDEEQILQVNQFRMLIERIGPNQPSSVENIGRGVRMEESDDQIEPRGPAFTTREHEPRVFEWGDGEGRFLFSIRELPFSQREGPIWNRGNASNQSPYEAEDSVAEHHQEYSSKRVKFFHTISDSLKPYLFNDLLVFLSAHDFYLYEVKRKRCILHIPDLLLSASVCYEANIYHNTSISWQMDRLSQVQWIPELSCLLVGNQVGFVIIIYLLRQTINGSSSSSSSDSGNDGINMDSWEDSNNKTMNVDSDHSANTSHHGDIVGLTGNTSESVNDPNDYGDWKIEARLLVLPPVNTKVVPLAGMSCRKVAPRKRLDEDFSELDCTYYQLFMLYLDGSVRVYQLIRKSVDKCLLV